MHRVTSAAVLANPAAQQAAQQDVSDHVSDALSGVPELSDRFSEASELETQDDAPLLQDRHAPGPFDGVTKRTQDSNHNTGTAGSAVQEALAVMRLAAPVTIQAISQYSYILSILATVGHQLGVNEFAAVAVGLTWFNLVRCFCFGLAGAYDTLGSQAHGSGNKAMVMSWGVTATAAMLLVNIPISVGMWYGGDAARVFFRQNAEVCRMTSTFCRFLMAGLFPWSLVTILTKFLQVQGQLWAPALCTVAAIAIHIPSTIMFVHWLGFVGAGWAVLVMRSVHLSITLGYVFTMGRRYITLVHKSAGLTGMYSKLGDLEEPAGHLHEQEAEHQADNLPQARSHTAPEALNPQRVSETSLAETRASSTEGAKAAQGQETPQQQLQQQQQQSLREARQPFKQLQQSQPQQQQQLELQHLHLLPHKTPVQTHLLQQKQQRPDPNSDHGQGHKQQASYQDVDLVDATSTTPPAQLSSATLQLSRPQEQQHAQSQTSALQQGQQQRQHAAVSPFASMQHLPHAAQDQQQLIQPQQHQQQEQQHSHAVGSTLAGMQGLQAAERSAVLQLQGWGLAVASLAPRRLWAFMSLGIPGGLASSVEGAAAEVTTALAGVLGTIQIDAHTTMLSVSGVLFTLLGFGFAVGCTIRVGNLLGAQQPAQARLSAVVSLSLGGGAACVVGLNMLLLSRQLGQAFTTDEEVLQVVSSLAAVVALFSICDGAASILAGALKGMGRQKQLMWVGIAGFWGAGVPLGYALAFPAHLRLSGLWLGQLAGSLIVVGANLLMLMRVNWQSEVDKALAKQSKK